MVIDHKPIVITHDPDFMDKYDVRSHDQWGFNITNASTGNLIEGNPTIFAHAGHAGNETKGAFIPHQSTKRFAAIY